MAETLVELVAKIKADATELEKGLTNAEKQTEASSKKMQDSLKKVGIAMAASGAAITAAMGLMGKAAIDEEINIKRLATTINNSVTAYDKVKDSLEAVIAATQRKTGIADNEQRDILNRLILVTNDYSKAMELLPTVLDLAAAGEMDATTAATYLGKAYLELEDGAEEVSVRFGQASLKFKDMADIQNRVAGSAENLANPLSVLKASVGDLSEVIGTFLLPAIKDTIEKIVNITIKIQDWANEHPALAGAITKVIAVIGLLSLALGSALLIIPKLIAGFVALKTVLIGSLIPSIWGVVTALWAQTTATLAAMAATGVLIPAAIAAVAAIALLTFGITKLAEQQKQQAGITDAVTESTQKASSALGSYTNKTKDAAEAQRKLNEQLSNTMGRLQTLATIMPADWYEQSEWRNLVAKAAGVPSIEASHTLSPEQIALQAMAEREIMGFASGGVVPGSIGQPQLAMVHGGETILPANESAGGVTINFTQPVFFDREDTMNVFIDKISRTLDRKYRLSGRSLA